MNKLVFATVFLGFASSGLSAQVSPLNSLTAVHALTNIQAARHEPAQIEATVTYYRAYEKTLFVQDGNTAIFVLASQDYKLSPGDRIRVKGRMQESFRPLVTGDSVTVIGHVPLPKPAQATFDDLIHAKFDCRLVTIRAKVLAADITVSSDRRSTMLQVQMDGGPVQVQIDSDDPAPLPGLLDAEVEVTGAVSGHFDGKMQMTGIVLHTPDLSYVKTLTTAQASPWSLPSMPMDEVISEYREPNESHRVRVQGTITYYIPGSAVVLQNRSKSLWINTRTRADLKVGDQADATGFPDVDDGFLKLMNGEIQDSRVDAAPRPIPVTVRDLFQSRHVFDLVSIEGEVIDAVREAGQDTYVMKSEGHIFSAIYRHAAQTSVQPNFLPAIKDIPFGSKVRVTGICILEDSNPFNAQVPFDLLLRNVDDLAVLALPSPLNVANLIKLSSVLVIVILAVAAWGWTMKSKVRRQTAALASRIAAEAALERHNAQIEQRRSHILEDINGTRPLAEVLEQITDLVSFHLDGAACWCEITDGARLGRYQADPGGRRLLREEIPARSGAPLGFFYAAVESPSDTLGREKQALILGTRLATLAIETRRLYSDLVRRSEFDLLTDIHNRFSLDKKLESLIIRARESAGIFGLIYVDLDDFKQVNDVYGHRVGDLYLQEAAKRMKRQLRSGDILARLGGDEFAALVPAAHSRHAVEEIAQRLERCFDDAFRLEGNTVRGSASIGLALYPEDGASKDSLLSAADAAMYVSKHMRHHRDPFAGDLPSARHPDER